MLYVQAYRSATFEVSHCLEPATRAATYEYQKHCAYSPLSTHISCLDSTESTYDDKEYQQTSLAIHIQRPASNTRN
jgi:hypothetical protein